MYYCGIDAHVRYLRLAVVDKHGSVVLESTIQNRDRERLLEQLAAWRPLAVVVETCPSWPWLYEVLSVEPGIEFHLAHAKHLRMIAHNAQKTDAVDARLLARMLLAGLIPEAYPRPESQREKLRLIRHHAVLVRERTGRDARTAKAGRWLRAAWVREDRRPTRVTISGRPADVAPVERCRRDSEMVGLGGLRPLLGKDVDVRSIHRSLDSLLGSNLS